MLPLPQAIHTWEYIKLTAVILKSICKWSLHLFFAIVLSSMKGKDINYKMEFNNGLKEFWLKECI